MICIFVLGLVHTVIQNQDLVPHGDLDQVHDLDTHDQENILDQDQEVHITREGKCFYGKYIKRLTCYLGDKQEFDVRKGLQILFYQQGQSFDVFASYYVLPKLATG